MAETKEKENNLIEKLFEVGAHFAYTKSRRHPSVKPYIFGNKNKLEIFDLEKTQNLLNDAKNYVKSLGSKKATILFVGGKNESKNIIKNAAETLGMPYVTGRWIGGTFTNFDQIKKRVKKLVDLKTKREKGEFSKYTKWEQVQIDRDIEKLEDYFGGIVDMDKLPDAMFVIDSKREDIAVKEAINKNIPIIAVVGSDCDIDEVAHPILGNDSSKKSIEFFVKEITNSYEEGLKEAPKKAPANKNTK